MAARLRRGAIWWADLPPPIGRRPVIVVSNDNRNRVLGQVSVLVVPVTSRPRPNLPSIVELDDVDGITGRALCDEVNVIPSRLLDRQILQLPRALMARVDRGLVHALGL